MTAIFGGPKLPTTAATAPATQSSYSSVANAAVNQAAQAAAAGGQASTIKTTPQGATSLPTIKQNPLAGI